jgi:hypothetical protein
MRYPLLAGLVHAVYQVTAKQHYAITPAMQDDFAELRQLHNTKNVATSPFHDYTQFAIPA